MYSRTWINAVFWLAWIGGGAWYLTSAWPEKMEGRTSLLIAIAALWINFYPRFLQGARLVCVANQVTILGIQAGNQLPIIVEIALKDLLGGQPSSAARQLMANVEAVRKAVENNSRDYLQAWLYQHPPRQAVYVPPDDLVRAFLQDPRTTPSFFIPLFVYNAGARYAEIGSVLMIAELIADRSRKWAYAAYFEMDESKLIHINEPTRDLDKLSASSPGTLSAQTAARDSTCILFLTTKFSASPSRLRASLLARTTCIS